MTLESPTGLRTTPAAALERPAAELPRWLGAALLTVLGAVALLLAWRRLAGALNSPLAAPALFGVALVAAGATAAARVLARPGPRSSLPPWPGRVFTWAPPAVLGVLGAALSLPGTSPVGLAALWTVLAAEELWSLGRRQPPGPIIVRPRPAPRVAPMPDGQLRYDPPQPPSQPVSATFAPEDVSPDDVIQQLTRSHAADGGEVLSGWLRVAMAEGQRSASLHVAFCPPFAQTPRLAVEQLGGPPARIKTVRLFPYGARFDLKLDQPSEAPSSLLLQFLARSTSPAGPGPEPEDENRDEG